jgi:hypothetical protein
LSIPSRSALRRLDLLLFSRPLGKGYQMDNLASSAAAVVFRLTVKPFLQRSWKPQKKLVNVLFVMSHFFAPS